MADVLPDLLVAVFPTVPEATDRNKLYNIENSEELEQKFGSRRDYKNLKTAWNEFQRQIPAAGTETGDDKSKATIDPKPKDKNAKYVEPTGMGREKEEVIRAFIQPLLFPNMMSPSRALLMYGPPGTGKSFFVPYIFQTMRKLLYSQDEISKNLDHLYLFTATTSDILSAYIGVTEKNLTKLFTVANDYAKKDFETDNRATSIIFIDEMESIAGSRKSGGHNQGAVTTLLQLMEGVDSMAHVIVIGATNLPDQIDSAILSRFQTKMFIDLPTNTARYAMLVHALVAQALKSQGERTRVTNKTKLTTAQAIDSAFTKPRAPAAPFKSFQEEFIALTGYSDEGHKKIIEAGQKDKIKAEKMLEFRQPSAMAVSTYGFSSRDLKNLFTNVIQILAEETLKKREGKTPKGDRCFLLCDLAELREKKCKQCHLSYQERLQQTLSLGMLTSELMEKIMRDKIHERGSGVKESEYFSAVLYSLYGSQEAPI